MNTLWIRPAKPTDGAQLAEIHRPYVTDTAITFQTVPTDGAGFAEKVGHMGNYPFLVAEVEGKVLGFCYGSPLRPHEAYRWEVELTVYVDQTARQQGVGSALYTALLEALTRQGYHAAYGCITQPNEPSMALHRRMGFTEVGRFPASGFKLGAWHDVAWMHKVLKEGAPGEMRPVAEVLEEIL